MVRKYSEIERGYLLLERMNGKKCELIKHRQRRINKLGHKMRNTWQLVN